MQTIVLKHMYRYSWLITFEIFQIFFLYRGVGGWVGGWGQLYPNFFWIFGFFFIFTRSLRDCGTNWSNLALLSQLSPVMLYAANGAVPQYLSPILFCFYIISVILTPGKINGIDLKHIFQYKCTQRKPWFFYCQSI